MASAALTQSLREDCHQPQSEPPASYESRISSNRIVVKIQVRGLRRCKASSSVSKPDVANWEAGDGPHLPKYPGLASLLDMLAKKPWMILCHDILHLASSGSQSTCKFAWRRHRETAPSAFPGTSAPGYQSAPSTAQGPLCVPGAALRTRSDTQCRTAFAINARAKESAWHLWKRHAASMQHSRPQLVEGGQDCQQVAESPIICCPNPAL